MEIRLLKYSEYLNWNFKKTSHKKFTLSQKLPTFDEISSLINEFSPFIWFSNPNSAL